MAKKPQERRGLGRGLSALMADVNLDSPAPGAAQGGGEIARRGEIAVPIESLAPNPEQPRRDFAQENLDELAASIREKGVIQPLIVRRDPAGGPGYQIVAGERRWRAAQMAQLHMVPVLVRELDDTEVLEVAIIENIQRADLNAVEEATAYRQLMERFGHTQEALARALGKSRSHIANVLRLLNLPGEVLVMLREGRLTAGHARAMVTAPDPAALARQVVAKGLSVRETERLARASDAGPKPRGGPAARRAPEKDADTRALEADLSASLGMKVALEHGSAGEGGQMVIRYTSLDDLDELCRRLTGF